MNSSQARLYLRKEKREKANGTETKSRSDASNEPATPVTSHPPVMGGHCARMFLAGRRDSCSGVRYPLFEEPASISPLKLLTDMKRGPWPEVPKTKPS